MKKNIQKIIFISLLFLANSSYSQKVAIIGINHLNPDGFSFLVTQDLANGEVIYFTENEYSDAANAFVDATESVVIFTAGSVITKGNVVFVNELGVANTFSVSCTGGGCGTAVISGAGPFALATDGEAIYAYTDSDINPANGITTIYSVMYTGSGEAIPPVNGGAMPTNENPIIDYPNAIVIDGFPAAAPNRVEFKTTLSDRTNINISSLKNTTNYLHAQLNTALSTTIFTNFNLISLPLNWLAVSGNLNSYKQAVIIFKVNEYNVANYIIEKSSNGNIFSSIATLSSKGNGTNSYNFIEPTSIEGTKYYRIKQVDVDGRFSYSNIVKLTTNNTSLITVFPNPVKNTTTISGTKLGTTLQLTNATGQILQTIKVTQTSFTIIMNYYPNGIYFLKTKDGITLKIIKH